MGSDCQRIDSQFLLMRRKFMSGFAMGGKDHNDLSTFGKI